MRAALVLAVLLVAGSARADKSEQTAQILSGTGAGVSSALVLSSFLVTSNYGEVNQPLLFTGLATSIVTPSLGEWYAGEWVTPGMGVRALAGGLALYAVRNETTTVTCAGGSSSSDKCQELKGVGIALLGVAAIAYIGGVAYDVSDADDAVDRYNAIHGYSAMHITATALSTPSGGIAPGVALGGSW